MHVRPFVNGYHRILTIVLLVILPCACMPRLPADGVPQGSKTYRISTGIKTGEFPRDYLLHIPDGYDGRRPLPMVVVVHGAFDNAKGMEEITGFSRLADREGFITLYPNGIGILGYLQHWNAGHCCGKAQADRIDDVGVVAASIESAIERVNVDRNRIFMWGFSNGGMFTHRFAAERGDLLAGAAALAASIGSTAEDEKEAWQIPKPPSPLPFLIMHGTADTHVPFDGQPSQRRGTPRVYNSVAESAAFWRTNNGCSDQAQTSALANGAVTRKVWSICTSRQPVWLYEIKAWGHIWMGKPITESLEADDPLKDFDAAGIIWDFFKRQSGPPDNTPAN